MRTNLEDFKKRALSRPEVKREYDRLEEEFLLLDQMLRARKTAGLTQAEIADRMGTTQSAIARLESLGGKHSPTLSTLRRYAATLGYRLELKWVKEARPMESGTNPS